MRLRRTRHMIYTFSQRLYYFKRFRSSTGADRTATSVLVARNLHFSCECEHTHTHTRRTQTIRGARAQSRAHVCNRNTSPEGPQRANREMAEIYILAICANASDTESVHTSIITRANAHDMQNGSTSHKRHSSPYNIERFTITPAVRIQNQPTKKKTTTPSLSGAWHSHRGPLARTRTHWLVGTAEKLLRLFPSRPSHFSRAFSTGK